MLESCHAPPHTHKSSRLYDYGNKLKMIRRQNETTWSLEYSRYGLRLAFKKIILHIKATSASVVNENLRSNVAGDSSVGWCYFMLYETRFSNDF